MSTPLSQALATLRRRYGDAVIQPSSTLIGGDPAWPTGIPAIDSRLAPGGLPIGRVSVLAAARRGSSGRLTLLQALAAIASREQTVVYLDLLGSLDPGFLADLGADLDSLLVIQPPSGRWSEGLTMARSLVGAGAPWLAIALPETPARRNDGWEHRLAWLVEVVAKRRAVCLTAAASPLPAPLGYASSLTLQCQPAGWQEMHGDIVGLRTRLTVAKSKIGAPGETAILLLRYPRPFAVAEVVGWPAVVEVSAMAESLGARRASLPQRLEVVAG
jgi:hypothetical protein